MVMAGLVLLITGCTSALSSKALPATSPSPTATSGGGATPSEAPASCSASMSNPTPGDGGSETLHVTSDVPNAPVSFVVHYRTTDHPFSGATGSSGAGSFTFSIGRPTVGYTVGVEVTVGQASCSTAFTPQ